MDNTPVVIDNITIRQDAQGRYCLNDLHRAAGGVSKDQPNFFIKRKETYDLVNEVTNSEDSLTYPVSRVMGRNGGSYVVKEPVNEPLRCPDLSIQPIQIIRGPY